MIDLWSPLAAELPPVFEALARALMHSVWQLAVLAGGLALSRVAVRGASARLRYGVATVALGAMLLLPAVTALVEWRRLVSASSVSLVPPGAVASVTAPARWDVVVFPWLLLIWTVGVTLMCLRLLGGWYRLRRFVAERTTELSAVWRARADVLIETVGLRRAVRVVVSAHVGVPQLVGCLRPVIVLPLAAVGGLPPALIEAALLHELIHIRRLDPWINLAQSIAETLLFYHPAVWWVSRVVHREREHCCDDAVVAITGDRLAYARALTELEAWRGRMLPQALSTHGGELMQRIRRIVEQETERVSGRVTSLIPVALTALLLFAAATVAVMPANVAGDGESSLSIAWLPEALTQWGPELTVAAETHGVDPDLLAIMTLIESGGNPDAVSRSGALGLMQVMPRTAAYIARERGVVEFTTEQLRDPATNLDFGAWYLAQQIARFGTDLDANEAVVLGAAAYNGGPKRVTAFVEQGVALSDETAGYMELVQRMWADRDDPTSPTFEAWMERVGQRMTAGAVRSY